MRAARTSGDADDALDHGDVSIAPKREFLVDVEERLKNRLDVVALIELAIHGAERSS